MKTILIVEDDPTIMRGVQEVLEHEHYTVLTAPNGTRGIALGKNENVNLIILDLGLPDINGEDVCRELRAAGVATPIMMLTSKSLEMDKVLGLEMGADDYMTKPFGIRELLARVRALLRRKGNLQKEIEECSFDDVQIDFSRQETIRNGKKIKLSVREYSVMKYLVQHEGEVVTRDMLLNDVWGYDTFPTTRTVDNYILALRKKLEGGGEPKHILTVHTAGYKFQK
jgi:DNA-binding response OmpR family regulator